MHGFDINPMAAWIVREELEHLDLDAYRAAAAALVAALESKVGDLYRTDSFSDSSWLGTVRPTISESCYTSNSKRNIVNRLWC
jgi:hypothetical protein